MPAASTHARPGHRRLLVPEVIQASAMDCGPASLKALLGGFGIAVSYGRLREACQTEVDGTSIDTLEELAVQLGVDAEQVMIPVDHVLLPEAQALPAIVVVRLPTGSTHFAVAWRRHGPLVQLMDPGSGRLWLRAGSFERQLYVHEMPVAVTAWREWAASEEFLAPLRRRLVALSGSTAASAALVAEAGSASDWRPLAALDAATRLGQAMVDGGALPRGRQALALVTRFSERERLVASGSTPLIPAAYWSARALPKRTAAAAVAAEEEKILLRGAVLVRGRPRRGSSERRASMAAETTPAPPDAGPPPASTTLAPASQAAAPTGKQPVPDSGDASATPAAGRLRPEVLACLEEPAQRPARQLVALLRQDGLGVLATLVAALFLASCTVLVEGLLLGGLLGLGLRLGLTHERLLAMAAVVVFLAAAVLLDQFVVSQVLRLGRNLEARLRIAFLSKIPRLGDRYFQSRLSSDMAERSHSVHLLRALPEGCAELLRSIFLLLLTWLGVVWLSPESIAPASLAAALSLALPLAVQPLLAERDLRVRSQGGALSRFYLDALLGIVPIHSHGAQDPLRQEHEGVLCEWTRAARSLLRLTVGLEALQGLAGVALAAWLIWGRLDHREVSGDLLLFSYWALALPALGQQVALSIRQLSSQRSVTLRLLEPLGAADEVDEPRAEAAPSSRAQPARPGDVAGHSSGLSIELRDVSVRVSGHPVLHDLNLRIPSRSQVAIVGPSGAGKSSLIGLLLGWHRPATGQVLVDDRPLGGAGLEQLRRQTVWVDPAVQIWNATLLDNLRYGAEDDASMSLPRALGAADLHAVLASLPSGLQTILGEGGALVSGGEGQRVRLGRGLLRPGVRLAILDEPFRGLARDQRRQLLSSSRAFFADATLLCVTHDLAETLDFQRVLVIEEGRLVEDGEPATLAAQPGSRYQALLAAEEAVRETMWRGPGWRHLSLAQGRLVEHPAEDGP